MSGALLKARRDEDGGRNWSTAWRCFGSWEWYGFTSIKGTSPRDYLLWFSAGCWSVLTDSYSRNFLLGVFTGEGDEERLVIMRSIFSGSVSALLSTKRIKLWCLCCYKEVSRTRRFTL